MSEKQQAVDEILKLVTRIETTVYENNKTLLALACEFGYLAHEGGIPLPAALEGLSKILNSIDETIDEMKRGKP